MRVKKVRGFKRKFLMFTAESLADLVDKLPMTRIINRHYQYDFRTDSYFSRRYLKKLYPK